MNKPMPDTDPLKRDEPGSTGRVPGNDVGGGGRPAGKPDDTSDTDDRPTTGDKYRPVPPGKDPRVP